MKREDINVTFEQNVLTLTGERKASFDRPAGPGSDLDNGTYHRSERAHGKFTRSFTLPATVDGSRISASYKDGVLTVRVPQREEAKPKQISVDLD
jgi:HSP20 family protein